MKKKSHRVTPERPPRVLETVITVYSEFPSVCVTQDISGAFQGSTGGSGNARQRTTTPPSDSAGTGRVPASSRPTPTRAAPGNGLVELSGTMFNTKHNAGLAPSSPLGALLVKVYGSDGQYVITRRDLLAQFGYKKFGGKNQGVIEACLAERGIVLSDGWDQTAIDDRVVLRKDESFFQPSEVARRLRGEMEMVVAGTVRVRYRDLLLLDGFGRNTPAARQAIGQALRLADLDISPPTLSR